MRIRDRSDSLCWCSKVQSLAQGPDNFQSSMENTEAAMVLESEVDSHVGFEPTSI